MKTIIANWKMNPVTADHARDLLGEVWKESKHVLSHVQLIVAPPFLYLPGLAHEYARHGEHIGFAAQDVFWEETGAYTGEVSPLMVKSLPAEYAIIGHSERRIHLKESDAMIQKKVDAALRAGLKVVLCVGEPTRKGKSAQWAKNYVKRQLQKDLAHTQMLRGISNGARDIMVAYEPVWAIGTGLSDTPKDALEMTLFIKDLLTAKFGLHGVRVLYGGSVSDENAASFLGVDEIDGALVGGASLKPEEFGRILALAAGKG